MLQPLPSETDIALAKRWACSRQTVWRLRRRGIDPADLDQVAEWVLNNQVAPVPMLKAVAMEISSAITQLRQAPPSRKSRNPYLDAFREGVRPDPRP